MARDRRDFSTVRYFAYGSNMLTARLHARIAGARRAIRARLPAHRLRFDKRGRLDGSGKCRIEPTDHPGDAVWGVLWHVPRPQLTELHRIEGVGRGYEVGACTLSTPQGEVQALTYFAQDEAVSAELRPFDWYLRLVIAGAVEHGLPDRYVERLRRIASWRDQHSPHARAAHRILRVGASAGRIPSSPPAARR